MNLRIGSRGSKLALWQSNWVKARLEDAGHEVEIEIIHTTGDKITDVALSKVGTKGLFTKEIEEALIEGRVDLAVHSLKDMPTELPEGLVLAAIPERADARDAMIGARMADLAHGARVGTSSLRRAAQLRSLRPDLVVESVRGNVDTRLRKQADGEFDAIMLAAAGLTRLGWESRIAEYMDAAVMCPAVGQGALAIETGLSGAGFEACLALDHLATRTAVTAERALLRRLGGGCQVPIGAHAIVAADGRIEMRSVVVHPEGGTVIRKSGAGFDAEALGAEMADALLAAGGAEVLRAVYG